jgi:hypothetical protein
MDEEGAELKGPQPLHFFDVKFEVYGQNCALFPIKWQSQ